MTAMSRMGEDVANDGDPLTWTDGVRPSHRDQAALFHDSVVAAFVYVAALVGSGPTLTAVEAVQDSDLMAAKAEHGHVLVTR